MQSRTERHEDAEWARDARETATTWKLYQEDTTKNGVKKKNSDNCDGAGDDVMHDQTIRQQQQQRLARSGPKRDLGESVVRVWA